MVVESIPSFFDDEMSAVEAVGLGRLYGDKWGLKEASFNIDEGCIGVLLGPNGAGKTTTIKILTTLLKPSRGRASVLGYDVVKDYRMIRRKIAYLPQECLADRNWKPIEAVKWFLVSRGVSLSEADKAAKYWLKELGLWEKRHKTVWRLSGGMARRVLVAMVLATGADIIFLDEPTTGLDVESRYAVWKILRELVTGGGTILLTTHNMREAELLADYVIMMDEGVTIVAGEPKVLLEHSPFEFRIIVENARENFHLDLDFLDLGDRRIIYARNESEVGDIVSSLNVDGSVKIEKVGLEDIYLHLIGGGRDG